MNVRDFLDVRVICETGSLRKAAAVLGVTQPTLSNRIAHLEDQLGATLFDRSRGQSQPTDLALFIARRAATMADEAARLTEETRRLASGRSGEVRIGVTPGPQSILQEVVLDLTERWPKLSLDLLTAPTKPLAEQLVERRLDLVVAPRFEDEHPSLVAEPLIESDIVVVAHPEHPYCTSAPASIEEILRHPIALPIAERHYLDVIRHLYGIDIDGVPGRILCSDPGLLTQIIRRSRRLVGAGPRLFFAGALAAGVLRVVDTPVPLRHQLLLHRNQDAFPLPAVERVRQALLAAFASAAAAQ